MKTVKFALIAVIVACTMVSLANADGIKEKPKFKKVVNITLVKAMKVPGLPQAIYQQVDPKEVLGSTQTLYTFEVTLNGTIYKVTGSRDEWIKFFKLEYLFSIGTKSRLRPTL
jgi:hypothetical protein